MPCLNAKVVGKFLYAYRIQEEDITPLF